MNIKIPTMLFALVLLVAGLSLVALIDWKLALGLFLYTWGNNLVYSQRVQQFVARSTGRVP